MLNRRIRNKLHQARLGVAYGYLQHKLSFAPEEVFIVAGDPRGGSTWLAELVGHIENTAMLWEPLAIDKVRQFAELGFCWRQYIPEDETWPAAMQQFDKLFSGKLLSPYLCLRTSPGQLVAAEHLLVKFCRANQLLPWLTKQFQFRYPPIYLVRHPCSVVASQLKQGGWEHVAPRFEIPSGPFRGFYAAHEEFIKSIDTMEKRLAFTWCLCNQIPLHHPENNRRWVTITYEQLLTDGAAELKRIEERWGVDFPPAVFADLHKASRTTVVGSPINQGKLNDQLGYWREKLHQKQVDDVLAVLDYFGITLYNADIYPTRNFLG